MNDKEAESAHANSNKRVWVVTGTSSGLGRSLVQIALAQGDCVVATVRNLDDVGVCEFIDSPESKSRLHVVKLDITAPFSEIRAVAQEAVSRWGHVDILVNNAGAGFLGLTEEVGAEGYQRQFAVNFFGPLNVTNAFLPYMRAKREGTIVFIGSRSSWRSHVPMMGTYAASKAALIAAAESLAAEVAHLNIRILNVLPGGMKTCSWDKMTLLPTSPNALLPVPSDQHGKPYEANDSEEISENPLSKGITRPDEEHISDYAELRERQVEWMRSAVCDGDPDKCAQAIYDIVTGENPESNDSRRKWPEGNMLVLGEDAGNNIRDKCDTVLRNLDEWKEVIRGVAADR